MNDFVNIKNLAALVLLAASIFFDLRTRKVPNQLLLAGLVSFCLLVIIFDGISSLWTALAGFCIAFVVGLPIYYLKIIGGGDFKLLLVLSTLLNLNQIIWLIIMSSVWGALLGVTKIVLEGKTNTFFKNIFLILKNKKPEQAQLNKIPFTFAILLGFLTSISLNKMGVLWI